MNEWKVGSILLWSLCKNHTPSVWLPAGWKYFYWSFWIGDAASIFVVAVKLKEVQEQDILPPSRVCWSCECKCRTCWLDRYDRSQLVGIWEQTRTRRPKNTSCIAEFLPCRPICCREKVLYFLSMHVDRPSQLFIADRAAGGLPIGNPLQPFVPINRTKATRWTWSHATRIKKTKQIKTKLLTLKNIQSNNLLGEAREKKYDEKVPEKQNSLWMVWLEKCQHIGNVKEEKIKEREEKTFAELRGHRDHPAAEYQAWSSNISSSIYCATEMRSFGSGSNFDGCTLALYNSV